MSTILLAAPAGQGGGSMGFLVMIIAIFAIMWFFMIRPQQKKQKEIRNFQNALAEGSKVIVGGGIYGVVKHIDLATNVIEVEISKGVTINVDKGAVFADVTASRTAANTK